MILSDVVEFLEKVPPFQFLKKGTLRMIAGKVSMEYYPKGTEILTQSGPPSEHLYIVQKGGVKIFVRSGTDEIIIDYRNEGDSFGFVSLYSGDKSRTSVVAADDTICYLIDKETFLRLHDSYPAFAEYFLRSYLGKYVDTTFRELYDKGFLYRSGNTLPFTTPVGDIATQRLITASPEKSIRAAARLMAERKISSLVVIDEARRPLGIVTDRDLREKVVATGASVTGPLRDIMTTSLVTIEVGEFCFEALLKMIRHGIHHLLVMDKDVLKGIVTNHDLMMLQGLSPITIAREIESRQNIECLIPISSEISSMVGLLLKEGTKASNISRIITELNERLLQRIIEIDLSEHGPPPVPFCWIVFGSEGRKEQTFKTDQDNALIYADPETPEMEKEAAEYFHEFAVRINDALVKCGFPKCPADYMAGNPKWSRPLKVWKRNFTEWITSSTPESILLSVIFFDFRPVYGDLDLGKMLRRHLNQKLEQERFFLARMAATIVDNRPPLGFFKTFVVEKSGEHKDQLNLKISALALIVDIVRLFSLERGVSETSTLERIEALKGQHGLIDEFGLELEQSFEFIMLLRVLRQFEQIELGSEPDNFINPNELNTLEKQTLKEIFQLISRVQDLIDQRYSLGTVS
ncbi:MAG: cyclic nucleotide-binding/CBS domain-containing protein [Actinobacteria bacterium]|nr:cyclic nucleotide-binding/CBS domain-containing protein [Actinomycetota bacterium]